MKGVAQGQQTKGLHFSLPQVFLVKDMDGPLSEHEQGGKGLEHGEGLAIG